MMKPNIHPEYRTVVFHDTSVDEYFKIGSTIKTDREIELDGVTYPYVTIGNDSNLLIVFYVQIMPDDFVMQLHRF